MKAQRAPLRLALVLGATALLAACATPPPRPPARPATVIARPAPPPPTVTLLAPASAQGEPWTSLSASFVMNDCADSPLVRARETMFTRSPARFEQLLRQSLPLMIYVQKQLQAAGIPGEFVMLPMLESSYQPHEPSRHGDPAGMWQLMPRTARARGVIVNRHYDGRLDPVASTRAAIDMLTAFGKQFGDWRLADMAYNAGPYAVLGALRRHPDLGHDAIPDLPVSHTTRNHLAKLLALSCILRDPKRFHVKLPSPSADDELAAVHVPAGTRIAAAARMAGTTESALRALNPGYLGAHIPAGSPRILLLPVPAAQALAAAMALDASEPVAEAGPTDHAADPGDDIPLPVEPSAAEADAATPAGSTHASRHRVRDGDTLWRIAHRYHVSVGDLKRWNGLHDDTLHPGELLRIGG